jgi:DNA-binding NarL/FixJ family response regulator
MFQVWALIETGELATVESLLELVDAAVASSVDEVGRAWAAFGRGRLLLRRGRLAQALAACDEAEARWAAVGQDVPARWARSGGVLAAAWAGDRAGATRRAAPLQGSAPHGMRILEPEASRALAWTAVVEGDVAGACGDLAACARDAFRAGDILHGVEAAHDLARLGDAAGAAAQLARCDLRAWPLGEARVAHARALQDGRVDDLAAAGARLAELGSPVEAAEAYAAAASLLRKDRRASAADRMAATGARLIEDCGPVATPGLVGLRVAAVLSSREREIAEMAAAGMSAKEIATRLSLSDRTVENHLQRAFVKLGVSSRSALADALAGR